MKATPTERQTQHLHRIVCHPALLTFSDRIAQADDERRRELVERSSSNGGKSTGLRIDHPLVATTGLRFQVAPFFRLSPAIEKTTQSSHHRHFGFWLGHCGCRRVEFAYTSQEAFGRSFNVDFDAD